MSMSKANLQQPKRVSKKLTLANHCQLKDIERVIHALCAIAPAGIGIGIDCREVYERIGTIQCLSKRRNIWLVTEIA